MLTLRRLILKELDDFSYFLRPTTSHFGHKSAFVQGVLERFWPLVKALLVLSCPNMAKATFSSFTKSGSLWLLSLIDMRILVTYSVVSWFDPVEGKGREMCRVDVQKIGQAPGRRRRLTVPWPHR